MPRLASHFKCVTNVTIGRFYDSVFFFFLKSTASLNGIKLFVNYMITCRGRSSAHRLHHVSVVIDTSNVETALVCVYVDWHHIFLKVLNVSS